MANSLLEKIYNSAPDAVKKVYSFVPFPLRMGKAYRNAIAHLDKAQNWTKEQADEYQLGLMRDLLIHAENNVPYYKKLFKDVSFNPKHIKDISQIEELPLLSKNDVSDNFENLKSCDCNKINSYEGLTGGTTGRPLRLLFSTESYFLEWAFLHAIWRRVGYTPDKRRISLMGVPFKGTQKKEYWKYDCFSFDFLAINFRKYVVSGSSSTIYEGATFSPKSLEATSSAIRIASLNLTLGCLFLTGMYSQVSLASSHSINPSY